ncbi:MAG: cupin domain-containing protein [Thermoplasmatota archaeon]
METYNLNDMEGKKLIYERDEFKARHIQLSKGDKIPPCDMSLHVIFIVLKGEVEIEVDDDKAALKEGECLFSEPGVYSMKTEKGTKLMGIQIEKVDR